MGNPNLGLVNLPTEETPPWVLVGVAWFWEGCGVLRVLCFFGSGVLGGDFGGVESGISQNTEVSQVQEASYVRQLIVCNLHCVLCTNALLYTVYCSLCTVFFYSIQYAVYCIPYTVHCILCIVFWYTAYCVLLSNVGWVTPTSD